MTIEVVNHPESSRYVLLVDGEARGIADYRIDGDTITFPHTLIEPGSRGRGLGERLVSAALEDVRPTGRQVVPLCWYVAEFIERNPDYADLLEAPAPPTDD